MVFPFRWLYALEVIGGSGGYCALVKIIRSPSAEADVIGMDGNLDDTIHLVLEDTVSLLDVA